MEKTDVEPFGFNRKLCKRSDNSLVVPLPPDIVNYLKLKHEMDITIIPRIVNDHRIVVVYIKYDNQKVVLDDTDTQTTE